MRIAGAAPRSARRSAMAADSFPMLRRSRPLNSDRGSGEDLKPGKKRIVCEKKRRSKITHRKTVDDLLPPSYPSMFLHSSLFAVGSTSPTLFPNPPALAFCH